MFTVYAWRPSFLPSYRFNQYCRLGSNQRLPAYKAGTLTSELRQHGTSARTRTGNLRLMKAMLHQLSYGGVESCQPELNRQPVPYEGTALPVEL